VRRGRAHGDEILTAHLGADDYNERNTFDTPCAKMFNSCSFPLAFALDGGGDGGALDGAEAALDAGTPPSPRALWRSRNGFVFDLDLAPATAEGAVVPNPLANFVRLPPPAAPAPAATQPAPAVDKARELAAHCAARTATILDSECKHDLPLARVKRLMREHSCHAPNKASLEAVELVARSVELFVLDLCATSSLEATRRGRNIAQARDLKAAIESTPSYAFLQETLAECLAARE
jgi:histone H3/H4